MKRTICFLLTLSIFIFVGCERPSGTVPGIPSTPADTQPSSSTPPAEMPSTGVPSTAAPSEATHPPATVPPTTESAPTSGELIGTLYTKQQLIGLDNTLQSYGCGRNGNPTRPSTPVNAQNTYRQYNATFIKEDIPTVYLTFDCGYEFSNLTGTILDTLKEKNIKAVFFVTLHYCKTNPHFVQRMIDEGHIVGNHSANHNSLPTLSIDDMSQEIMSLHNYVKENFGYQMFLFRPPKGEYSVRSLALAQSLGYESVLWSFAYKDWVTDAQPDIAQSLRLISGCVHNGAIFLLHSVSATNAALLGDLIDELQLKGYTIAPYPQPA